jgi:hypothetical protein
MRPLQGSVEVAVSFLRYLRIAFSVSCGIVCVLQILLWVRSYWIYEYVAGPLPQSYAVSGQSLRGLVVVGVYKTFLSVRLAIQQQLACQYGYCRLGATDGSDLGTACSS